MNCYNNNEKYIFNNLNKIILERGDFPGYVSNPKSPIDTLEEDLQGKKFSDLADEKQKMIYGDITTFNENAFYYYIFEIMKDCMERENFPTLMPMFLLGLSRKSMTFDNRLQLLKKNERQIILKFLECILKYITTSNNNDAIDLKEDYLKDIEEIIYFWKTIQ